MNTEAEVAAEHVLLAVHEPMRLSKRQMNAVQGEAKTEHDLLQDLLNQSYPIPILGDAGSGKSHVVRWLDAKLKVHETSADWHIRRIPKGASLRQVLEILLDGLDGENFETIRARVRKVGEGLKVEQVANLLIAYIENALADLHDKKEAYCLEIKSTGNQVPKEDQSRMGLLKRHAKPGGLATLVGDSTFKKRLIGEGKCIYQLAKRFTEGKTTKEFDKQTEEIVQVEDFDLLNNPDDFRKFSHDAQTYIKHSGLSNHERQTEAVKLVNEVLDDVLNRAFSNLYQVEGFTDLFTEIRRHLKQQNRTLVILVEDLAAISAIKDELLDNLLIQDTYDGEQELCSIRSVFAVTTESEGFKAFSSRRNTLGSRLGNTEWHIDNASMNEADTMSRIQDFCGRYLNAARIGNNSLKQSYDALSTSSQWPSVWHSSESDVVDVVNQFGSSPRGYPLFPFNKKALEAMVHAHCYSSGQLQFVPRDIINRILKDVLINYREIFLNNNFPNGKFLEALPLSNKDIPTELKSSLNMKIDMSEHLNALVAIWGYQARDLNELLHAMPAEVARVFGTESFAAMLDNISPDEMPKPLPVVNPVPIPHEEALPSPISVPKEHDRLKVIASAVDAWFADKKIEQGDASEIRKVLLASLETACKYKYSDWVAVKDLPSRLYGGKHKAAKIHIAFNMNNPAAELYFGDPPSAGSKFGDYGTNTFKYKYFLIALFRHKEYGHWKYTGGYADYCHYQNFITDWVKDSLKVLICNQRETAEESIIICLQNALVFEPQLAKKNGQDKLRFLCHAFKTNNDEKEKFYPPPGIESYLIETPVSEWNDLKKSIATEWEENQNKWLKCFSPEHNYAVEGDLLKSIIRGALDHDVPVPKNISRVVKNAQAEVKRDFKELEILEKCNGETEFKGELADLDALLKNLSDAGQYQNLSNGLSSKKMRNIIERVIGKKSWPTAKALIDLLGPFEVTKSIFSLNNIDAAIANDVRDLLDAWISQYDAAGGALRIENHISGNSNTAKIKEQVDETIDAFGEAFNRLEGLNNDKIG